MNRRSFIKILTMAFPAIFAPWPKALAGLVGGVDDTPTSLLPADYFRTGMNMVLLDHGIYVTKVESVRHEAMFANLIRGLACELKDARRTPETITASIGHRAKYFSFMIDQDAMYDVHVRQRQLKEAINSILKAFGKIYL